MKVEKEKIDVVTIQGMQKLFSVSRSTLYKKYIPKLTQIPTKNHKVFFGYQEAKELHDKMNEGTENFNVIA